MNDSTLDIESMLDGAMTIEDEEYYDEEYGIEEEEDALQDEVIHKEPPQDIELEKEKEESEILIPDISASHNLFKEEYNKEQEELIQNKETYDHVSYDEKAVEEGAEEIQPPPYPDLIDEKEEILKSNEIDQVNTSNQLDKDSNKVAMKVLQYVCKQTIEALIKTYSSKIYTKEYTETLMNKYLDDEIDSNDPLFKQLILECIEEADEDKYLGELTKDVLEYISNC